MKVTFDSNRPPGDFLQKILGIGLIEVRTYSRCHSLHSLLLIEIIGETRPSRPICAPHGSSNECLRKKERWKERKKERWKERKKDGKRENE